MSSATTAATSSSHSNNPNVLPASSSQGKDKSKHNPIWSLENQYMDPVGNRVVLAVRANPKCVVLGGMEAVLKHVKHHGHLRELPDFQVETSLGSVSRSNTESGRAIDTLKQSINMLRFDSLRLEADDLDGTFAAPTADSAAEANPFFAASAPPMEDDPFDLYAQPPPTVAPVVNAPPEPSPTIVSTSSTTSTSSSAKKKGGFLKKVKNNIERGVTHMAIKADKGKNPDIISLQAHLHPTPSSPHGICIGVTENKPMPTLPEEADKTGGILFTIPITVPPNVPATSVLRFTLLIRSGAALLKSKALQKNYTLGMAYITLSDIVSTLKGGTKDFFYRSLPLSGGVLQGIDSLNHTPGGGSALDVFIAKDLKFPPLAGLGWSLSDPRVFYERSSHGLGIKTWYGTDASKVFNLPLDQPYAFALPRPPTSSMSQPSTPILLATERVIESTMVLPTALALSKIFLDGARQSAIHATSVYQSLQKDTMKMRDPIQAMQDGHAEVQFILSHLIFSDPANTQIMGLPSQTRVSINIQRPDSIFEKKLGGGVIALCPHRPNQLYPFRESISLPFHPLVLQEHDPMLLPGVRNTNPNGQYVGCIRLEFRIDFNSEVSSGGVTPDTYTVSTSPTGIQTPIYGKIEGYVDIEPFLNMGTKGGSKDAPLHCPVFDTKSGKKIGDIAMMIHARTLEEMSSPTAATATTPRQKLSRLSSAKNGLVSLVGMDTYAEQSGANPLLDYDIDYPSPSEVIENLDEASEQRRKAQLVTMDNFLSPNYLAAHLSSVRKADVLELDHRFEKYKAVLLNQIQNEKNEEGLLVSELPVYKRMVPRPFRPSSSRSEVLLRGIPFNVHVQTLSINSLEDGNNNGAASSGAPSMMTPMALFHNVTHGAPSDHARGFSGPTMPVLNNNATGGAQLSSAGATALVAPEPVVPGSNNNNNSGSNNAGIAIKGASGGLRRLEIARRNAAKSVRDSQNSLIQAVSSHFMTKAKTSASLSPEAQRCAMKTRRHVPADDPSIAYLRSAVTNATERLHALTWDVAMRRGNCFSQALGIGITSYLTSLSDSSRIQAGWADLWVRHGYLITFEGLLSAAGKELGMIEDASVGIGMLKMVSVVLISDDGTTPAAVDRVPVPHSPYVRWIQLTPSGIGSRTQYRFEVGLDPSYYTQRVPGPLLNQTPVRFYPLLYQMGVDIRQWGVNQGMRMKGGGGGNSGGNNLQQEVADDSGGIAGGGGGLIDDEDDDEGIPDNDVMIALNIEAFRRMNAYAHAVSPTPDSTNAAATAAASASSTQSQQPTHPLLNNLYESIRASAGKMEHSVVDHAATACARLGGGSTIFCKSGKDRTAMQVTFKASQFVNRYMDGGLTQTNDNTSTVQASKIYADAALMRIHGTRLPICEKNVGQSKYAFNSLQSKFMPDALKPPPSTLAGFLKGGRVFSREGAIES